MVHARFLRLEEQVPDVQLALSVGEPVGDLVRRSGDFVDSGGRRLEGVDVSG